MLKNFFKKIFGHFKFAIPKEVPFLKEASVAADWLTECLVFQNYHTGTDMKNMASMAKLLSEKQNRDFLDKAMENSVKGYLVKHFLENLTKNGIASVFITKNSASEIFSNLRKETGIPFEFPDSRTKMNLSISANRVVAKWGKEKEEVLLGDSTN